MVSRKTVMQGYVLLLVIVCLTVMVVASVMYFKFGQQYEEFIKLELVWTNLVLMMLGIVMMMVVFLGYIGVCVENPAVLGIYATSLLLVGFGELALGMMAFATRSCIKDEVEAKGAEIFGDYNNSIRLINDVHMRLRCCGFINPYEYDDNGSYPDSCCGHITTPFSVPNQCRDPYPYGCKELIVAVVKFPLSMVGSVSMLSCILAFLGVALAFYDIMALKQEDHSDVYE